MSVEFSVGNSSFEQTGTTVTVALNIADSLANIVVATYIHNGASGSFSSLKYDGVDMTYVDVYVSGGWHVRMHYLVSPPTGSKNCVGVWSVGSQNALFAAAFKGVRISDPIGARTKTAVGGGGFTGTVPSVPGAAMAIDGIFSSSDTWPAISGTQTQQADIQGSGDGRSRACYNATGVPGDVAFAYTGCGGGIWMGTYLHGITGGGPTWWFFANKWRDFMRDLKAGLVPPDVLRQRYGDLMTI